MELELSKNLFAIKPNHHDTGSIIYDFPLDFWLLLDRRCIAEITVARKKVSMQGGPVREEMVCTIEMLNGKHYYTLNLEFLKTF